MVERIDMYETEDGQLFTTKQAALDHEAMIEYAQWYQENKLFDDGLYIGWENVKAWLKANKTKIKELLRCL